MTRQVGSLGGELQLHRRPVIAAACESLTRDPFEFRAHHVGDRQAAPGVAHRIENLVRKLISLDLDNRSGPTLDVVSQRDARTIRGRAASRRDADALVAALQVEVLEPVAILDPLTNVEAITGRARASARAPPR